jgi:hypothetical protein
VVYFDRRSEYGFVTEHDVVYKVVFAKEGNLFLEENELNPLTDRVYQVGFFIVGELATNFKGSKGEAIRDTIKHIIQDYLNYYPDRAVTYVCLDDEISAKARYKLFQKWFGYFEQTDIEQHAYPSGKYPSGMLVKKTNPDYQQLVDAYQKAVDFYENIKPET